MGPFEKNTLYFFRHPTKYYLADLSVKGGGGKSAEVRFEETTQCLQRLHVFTQYTRLLVHEDGRKSNITY